MSGELAITLFVLISVAILGRSALSRTAMLDPRLRKALKKLTGYAIALVIAIIICTALAEFLP